MNTRHVTSPFGFYNDREMPSIDKEIVLTDDKPARSSTDLETRPTLYGDLEKGLTQSNSQNHLNSSRLSRRVSMAVQHIPNTSRHSRKRSDFTELLCEAAAVGNTQLIGRLLGAGGDFRKQNVDGLFPLHIAAMAGQGDAVRCLVRMGAEIEGKDSQGYSPLHRAVMSNRVSLISHLTNLGADVDATGSRGWTALHIAASDLQFIGSAYSTTSQPYLQSSPLRFSVAFQDQNKNNRRPPSLSNRNPYDECSIIEALVRSGANTEVRNKEGETPLHVAVREGNLENARLLLDQGAQINVRNNRGMTPLGVLASLEKCNDALSSLLLERGAQVTPIEPKRRKGPWFWKAAL